jgi:hypothetical protein
MHPAWLAFGGALALVAWNQQSKPQPTLGPQPFPWPPGPPQRPQLPEPPQLPQALPQSPQRATTAEEPLDFGYLNHWEAQPSPMHSDPDFIDDDWDLFEDEDEDEDLFPWRTPLQLPGPVAEPKKSKLSNIMMQPMPQAVEAARMRFRKGPVIDIYAGYNELLFKVKKGDTSPLLVPPNYLGWPVRIIESS